MKKVVGAEQLATVRQESATHSNAGYRRSTITAKLEKSPMEDFDYSSEAEALQSAPQDILADYAREIERLRSAIRSHRDDLGCRERVLQDSILYAVLPEGCALANGTGAIVKRRRVREDMEAELQVIKAKVTRLIRLVQEMGR